MAKLVTDPIGSFTQTAITTINSNFSKIVTAMENTLSRDGTIPNQMVADFDMNRRDILNAKDIYGERLIINGMDLATVEWIVGSGVPSPLVGKVGDLYLNADLGDVYGPKTESGWGVPISNLKGPAGPRGPQGIQGIQGVQGTQGPQGVQGIQGLEGDKGDSYAPDAIGPASGRVDFDGEAEGFSYLDIDNGFLYFKRSATSGDWSAAVEFGQGPQGIQGLQGPQGVQGIQGVQGEQGIQGESGTDGAGVPEGGTIGQALIKASGADYDTQWVNPNALNVTANTIPVNNAAGTLRENKTFAEVSALLDVGNLPWVDATKFGVVGDGSTDSGPALQAIIDSLDVNYGGTILLPAGDIRIETPVDISGRTQIQIVGQGGGASNGGKTMIRTNLTTVPDTRLFDLRGSNNTTFKDIWFQTLSTTFSGWWFDLDRHPIGGSDNTYTRFIDCNFFSRSVNCVFHMLQGSTRGVMERCIWAGAGILIYGARPSAPLAFSGVWNFISCDFKPTGEETNGAGGAPIYSPGGGWVFTNCNVQAGTVTGKGRFIVGANSIATEAESLSLLGCTFYDVTTAGGVWIDLKRGKGLVIQGCFVGGHTGQDFIFLGGSIATGNPELDGFRGAVIMGNSIHTMNAFITTGGTIGGSNIVRNLIIGGNYLLNVTSPFSSLASAKNVVSLGNSHYGTTTSYGATLLLYGLPIYANRAAANAAGLQTGQVYLSQAVSGENVVAAV